MGTMNTLTMDLYAAREENSEITFIHNWPGWVDTGNAQRSGTHNPGSWSTRNLLLAPYLWFTGQSIMESGERHLYMATGGHFGGKEKNTRGGSKKGLFILDNKCDVAYDEAILEEFRSDAQERVWNKTTEILKPHM